MPRLIARLRDFGNTGLPSFVFTWSQRIAEQIEAANSSLQDQIDAINEALATAQAAQATANTVTVNDAISVSYTAPGDVLSASDAGTDATITIADHERHYGDHLTVDVAGGAVAALAYSTDYYIYYDQTSREGGTVTYAATTNPNEALPNHSAGRHFVGKVSTPAAGAPVTTGGAAPPAGGGTIDKRDVYRETSL